MERRERPAIGQAALNLLRALYGVVQRRVHLNIVHAMRVSALKLITCDTYRSITALPLSALEDVKRAANADEQHRILDQEIDALPPIDWIHQHMLEDDTPSVPGQRSHRVMQRRVHRHALRSRLVPKGPSRPH